MSPRLPRLTAKDVERILLKAGFEVTQSRGSHRYYRKGMRIVTVAVRGNRIIPPGTLLSILRQAGIGREDLVDG